MTRHLHPLARGFLALIFLTSGIGTMAAFSGVSAMMGHGGFPLPSFFLAGAITLAVLGGLALLAGCQTWWVSLALFAFLISATVIFHASQPGNPVQRQQRMIEVIKDLAIMGGPLSFISKGREPFRSTKVARPIHYTRLTE